MDVKRAPQRLFDLAMGTDQEKRQARSEVLKWINSLRPRPNEVVEIPDPDTGEPVRIRYNRDQRLQ